MLANLYSILLATVSSIFTVAVSISDTIVSFFVVNISLCDVSKLTSDAKTIHHFLSFTVASPCLRHTEKFIIKVRKLLFITHDKIAISNQWSNM